MRRRYRHLGLATSLAALLTIAIGPATASAGTPPAHTQIVAPHVKVTQGRSRCSNWFGIPDRAGSVQARACISKVRNPPHPGRFLYFSAYVRNQASVPQHASVLVYSLERGERRHYLEKTCNLQLRAGETLGCRGGPVDEEDAGSPIWTGALVYTSRHGNSVSRWVYSPAY